MQNMKKILLLSAILTIASSSQSVVQAVCDKQQEFLKYFAAKKVTIFDEPRTVPDTQSCVNEWKQHGVCCEETSLKRHLIRDLGDLPLFVQEMHKEMLRLNESLSIITHQFKTGQDRLQSRPRPTVEADTQEEVKEKALVAEIQLWIAEMDTFMQLISKQEAVFVQAQTRCGEKLNEMRSRSVCSLCSGRYAEFSIKDKAIVKQEDCNSFVDSCFEAWVSMIDFMYVIEGRKRLCKRAKEQRIPFSFETDMPIFDRMLKWFIKTGTLAYIKDCGTADSAACTEASKAAICNRMLNLAKPTFLKDSLNFFISTVGDQEKTRLSIARKEALLKVLLSKTTPDKLKNSLLQLKMKKLKLLLLRAQNKLDLAAQSHHKLEALENHFAVESRREHSSNKLRLLSAEHPATPSFDFGLFADTLQLTWKLQAPAVSAQMLFSDVTVSPISHLPTGHQPIDLSASAAMLLP